MTKHQATRFNRCCSRWMALTGAVPLVMTLSLSVLNPARAAGNKGANSQPLNNSPSARTNHTLVNVGGQIFLFGGAGADETKTAEPAVGSPLNDESVAKGNQKRQGKEATGENDFLPRREKGHTLAA